MADKKESQEGEVTAASEEVPTDHAEDAAPPQQEGQTDSPPEPDTANADPQAAEAAEASKDVEDEKAAEEGGEPKGTGEQAEAKAVEDDVEKPTIEEGGGEEKEVEGEAEKKEGEEKSETVAEGEAGGEAVGEAGGEAGGGAGAGEGGTEEEAVPGKGGEEVAETPAEGQEAKEEDGEKEGDGEEGDGEKEGKEGEGEKDEDGEKEEVKEGDGEKEEGKDGEEKEEGEKEGEAGVEQTASTTEEDGASPLPQSDSFTEGERPESPLGVGEKLSREHTPIMEEDETLPPEMVAPTTPDRTESPDHAGGAKMTLYEEDEEDEEQEEEKQEEEEPQFDREQLIEKYHAALADREQLQTQNYQLQHKLADYFRKKKADERQDYDKNVTDQEQRYLKYMAQLEDLRRQDEHERDNSMLLIEDLKGRCEDKNQKVDDERTKFVEFRKQVALNAINGRSGKPIPPKDIDQYLSNAVRKEGEVVVVRLENIKLKNKLKKKEQQLKSKEELAEGLHLIDFEQLKIENQTYNEKIEERNEELLKLRKKITSTVQVLTHLKEKLQFVYAENHVQKAKLKDVESLAAQRRDILSRTKQARDSLRIDNQKLRQNCGLLGNEPLLRDFEDRKDEGDDLKVKLDNLRMLHAELTLNCTQVRRKIEQARNGHP